MSARFLLSATAESINKSLGSCFAVVMGLRLAVGIGLLLALGVGCRDDGEAKRVEAPPPSAAKVVPPVAAPPVLTAPVVPAAVPIGSWTTLADGVELFRETRHDATGAAVEWVVARLDLERVALRARAPGQHDLSALASDTPLLLAVNGGFFEPSLQASGLIIDQGKLLNPQAPRGGSGVLLLRAGRATVETQAWNDFEDADFAMQCGPRLVEAGGMLGIRRDDGKRAERTAACVRNAGRELDLVLAYPPRIPNTPSSDHDDGPTLYQLGQWLTQPLGPNDKTGCELALNLDGGPSTGLVVPSLDKAQWIVPRGPVPWALAVIARPH